MKRIKCTLLLLLIACTSCGLAAQDRLDRVEQQQAAITERVSALEKRNRTAEPEKPRLNAPPLSAWRRLKHDMTEEQVKKLLGEPEHVMSSNGFTLWTYRHPKENSVSGTFISGSITFSDKGTVQDWNEPSGP